MYCLYRYISKCSSPIEIDCASNYFNCSCHLCDQFFIVACLHRLQDLHACGLLRVGLYCSYALYASKVQYHAQSGLQRGFWERIHDASFVPLTTLSELQTHIWLIVNNSQMAIMKGRLALVLLCLVVVVSAQGSGNSVRGVNPAQAKHYGSVDGTFTCIDGSKTMPFSRVNDEYCDCLDGSDEPGKDL